MISIGTENAIKLYDSNWWEGVSHREIANFQLFTAELCVPFDIFQNALEKSLGRSVFTHEFGCNYNGIVKEFLGEKSAPTLSEILELIPENKRIMVINS